MKKIVLTLMMSFMAFFAVEAQTSPLNETLDWKELICQIARKYHKGKARSIAIAPQVFWSDEYICLPTETPGIENATISITNENGVTVKTGMFLPINDKCLAVNIGDLKAGEYQVRIETDKFILTGRIVKE